MRKFFLIIFTFVNIQSFACINEYRTKLNGEMSYDTPLGGIIHPRKKDIKEIELLSSRLIKEYQKNKELSVLSDFAANLIYLGHYDSAKTIYFEIENSKPNLYTTASNLGTIYELTGNNDSAYYWINKSIKLNPNSHKGSEWIHLKILMAKLNNQDLNYSILNLDFGNTRTPVFNKDSAKSLKTHIEHQLRERFYFIDPENKIMGNILFDYGNVLSLTNNLEDALEVYDLAKKYGFNSELMELRISYMAGLTHSTKNQIAINDFIESNPLLIIISGFVFIFIMILLLLSYGFKRNKKKLSKQ